MSLKSVLTSLIQSEGPLSVARYMEEVLSHPTYGYYKRKDPFGVKGDFTTAPEISQIFGELLGIWCAVVWQTMGSPSPFMLVEIGPGRGTLMRDILRGTRHVTGFHQAMEVHMIETSPHLVGLQQRMLKGEAVKCFWHTDITYLPEKPIVLVANELFDALPVYQYVKTKEGWREKRVGLGADGELTFALSPVRNAMSERLDKEHGHVPEGGVFELCPAGINLMRDIALRIKEQRGAALIVDYGYDFYGYKDTLQALKKHQYHPVLETPGEADVTAHVDFISLMDAAECCEVDVYGAITQSALLGRLGVELRAKALLDRATPEQQQEIVSSVKRLMAPEEMGILFKAIAVVAPGMPAPPAFEG